jgi:exonuclease SbcC
VRPHRIRLRAFGPFAGEVQVDLDALAADGLFLLHGETGSGKTTLLDGIGFALYGRVPGVRGRTGRLRSDHADPAVRTEVELEVTLAGRRWRITRSPAQERPKSRGAGTTTEQARIHLEELREGQWASVSTRIDEAAAELDPLLGMSADQFFQVVLLPQGEFAQFLRADSRSRGELLQRLFATERFKAVEDWLVARRTSTAATVAAARQELAVLAARLAQAAGVPAPEATTSESLAADWGPVVLEAAGTACEQARAAALAATAVRDAVRAEAEQTTRVHRLQERRRGALARRAALDDVRPVHEALEVELKAAARAAELLSVLDDAGERERSAVAAGSAEASARASLTPVGVPVDAAPAALRSAADAARRRVGRLEALRGVADALKEERCGQADAAGEADRLAAALEALEERRAVLPRRRTAARNAVEAAREAVQALPGVEARAAGLGAACTEALGLQASLAQAERLREEHVVARETLVSLREREQVLREARFVSMIAELADRLEDGAPCEVCGSTSHPDPYLGDGDSVTRDDEDRARRAAEQAARDVAAVEARAAAEAAVTSGHRDRLAATGHADVDLASLEQREAAARADVLGLQATAAGLGAATAALEALDREATEAEAERARLSSGRDAAARRAAEAGVRAQAAAERLHDALEGAVDLDTALTAAAGRAAACDAVLEAVDDAERASAEAVRAAATALSAAEAAGFADVAAARAAVRTPTWRDTAAARLREGDDERAAVEAVLADHELQDLPAEPADVTAASAALADADLRLREAGAVEAAATGRLRQLEQLVPQLVEAQSVLVPLEQAAAQVRRLADLCSGGGANALRMTLTSFVLAARLEEVAAVASQRLLRMTQGRYSLVHTDGAVKGGARSGLGLLARDSWTGQDRDTSTLSGGETFLASLALALGLADVVQAEAGGTRIEALFVDEGFGTLDEDTLDEVMDVLDGLREGGRVVGLVSHVAELRARIPAQVHVRKTRRGSDVVLLGC